MVEKHKESFIKEAICAVNNGKFSVKREGTRYEPNRLV